MFTAFYTLVRLGPTGPSIVTEPGHPGKVKSYTKAQFARSARSQAAVPETIRILEIALYDGVGGINTRWVD